MKRERVNKDNIHNTRVIIKDIKKGFCNTKEEYNLAINICKTIINKKASGNEKVLQKLIIHKKEMGVDKKNKVIDQVNEITQAKNDYLKNVNEDLVLMNESHTDPKLTLKKLNKINLLLDESINYEWKLSKGVNRKKYELNMTYTLDIDSYTDIIYDKLEIVNGIGTLIDDYISIAYNLIGGIKKSHKNDNAYNILAEDLKICKGNIVKIINTSNVFDKESKLINK